MIHSIAANKSSFHTVTFTEGLNIVLAERAETSSSKDTRNGVGKTTLIEIIHFCLGSRVTKGKGLVIPQLEEWEFTIEITLAGNKIKATRPVAKPNRIVIDGPTGGWVEIPDLDEETGEFVFNVARWKTLLGWALFGVPRTADNLKYKPSFRSLISYFIRHGNNAYSYPFSHYRNQKTWDIQLHIAYLLDLNWEYASRWQDLRDKEDGLNAISKAIKTGAMDGAVGTIGQLDTQRIQLQEQVDNAKVALDSFNVHPQYEAIQATADEKTAEIRRLNNKNVSDQRKLNRYKDSVADEKAPSTDALDNLYEESGVVLPDSVKKTLSDARQFHKDIVANRKAFLQAEIRHVEEAIRERKEEIARLSGIRAKAMELLQTYGALQEMTLLQESYLAQKEQLDKVCTRLQEMRDLKKKKREVKTEKTELARVAEQDHEQREAQWSAAVKLFNEHSQALYERPGDLIIEVTDKGYSYEVKIERSSSEGIGKMKIFCFDLTALQIQSRKQHKADFIIHDSLIFDSVDSRQIAKALERAAKITAENNSQYICTMNSDMVPRDDFVDEFDFDQHVRLTLTDATESGSLLGIRFERNERKVTDEEDEDE